VQAQILTFRKPAKLFSVPQAKNKGGRPPKLTPEIVSKARELVEQGQGVEEAAKALGVGKTQLYEALKRPVPIESPKAPPAGSHGAANGHPADVPQGGPTVATPDRLLADVREILGARNPAALEELEEGLVLRARDEAAYRVWLARPFPAAAELSTDPRTNAQRLLAELEADYRRAPILRRGAIAEKIVAACRELRQYFPPARPPRPKDEIVEALRELDGEALARLERDAKDPIRPEEIAA